MFIIVTSDDFRPSIIPLFEDTWDKFKEKHPDLFLNMFVPARWHNKDEEDVSLNKDFFNFCKKRPWLDIIPHGYLHELPPENLRSFEEQHISIKKSLEMLKRYLKGDALGYKCPFYRGNEDTIGVLKNFGFDWFSQWWYICPLRIIKKPMPQFIEVPSHTTSADQKCPDNIDLIYNKVDEILTNLEKQGHKYSTINDIIRNII